MIVGLVSAIYGGYDSPKPLPDDHGFDDAVLVTDAPVEVDGWRVVVEPVAGVHPRLAAKRAKCQPWLYVDAEASVWIDGAYQVASSSFRVDAERHLLDSDLVVFTHPEGRAGPWAEAHFCHDWPKYRDWPLIAQVEHYRAEGLPDDAGLWALGCIARRHTEQQMRLGADWLAEQYRWGIQDQVSFPYLMWREGIVPSVWETSQWGNPWVQWIEHRDDH